MPTSLYWGDAQHIYAKDKYVHIDGQVLYLEYLI